ncbi:HAUS augmin-like complex subunit 1 [Armadillidium vulgare]|nr:HAUS augmin-like complex subunit 1 [Armadillidium vulgare]
MTAKKMEVLKWLEEMFSASQIPPFEKSEANIEKLYQLMLSSKNADSDLDEVEKYLKYKTQYYEHEGNLLEETLRGLQLSPNNLGAEEQSCLNYYSALCSSLNVHSVLPSNVILAINDLEEQHRKAEESLRNEKIFADTIYELSKSVASSLEEVKKVSENAKQTSANQENEIARGEMKQNFNKEKLKKYQSDLKYFETKLKKAGYEEDIKFSEIGKKIQELTTMTKELEDKERKLEGFTLPPDLTLAEMKVEEMRQTLSKLMNEIVQNYNNKG